MAQNVVPPGRCMFMVRAFRKVQLDMRLTLPFHFWSVHLTKRRRCEREACGVLATLQLRASYPYIPAILSVIMAFKNPGTSMQTLLPQIKLANVRIQSAQPRHRPS